MLLSAEMGPTEPSRVHATTCFYQHISFIPCLRQIPTFLLKLPRGTWSGEEACDNGTGVVQCVYASQLRLRSRIMHHSKLACSRVSEPWKAELGAEKRTGQCR